MVQRLHKQIVEIESPSQLQSLRPSRPFVWVRETAKLYRFDPDTNVFTQYPASPSGGTKVYRALITQRAAGAPTDTVIENSLVGDRAWNRNDVGTYYKVVGSGDLTGKVFPMMGGAVPVSQVAVSFCSVVVDGENDQTLVQIQTKVAIATDSTVVLNDDGVLTDTPIEIVIYP